MNLFVVFLINRRFLNSKKQSFVKKNKVFFEGTEFGSKKQSFFEKEEVHFSTKNEERVVACEASGRLRLAPVAQSAYRLRRRRRLQKKKTKFFFFLGPER